VKFEAPLKIVSSIEKISKPDVHVAPHTEAGPLNGFVVSRLTERE
jgi:hypothetical protein